jgi:hypothetical protein
LLTPSLVADVPLLGADEGICLLTIVKIQMGSIIVQSFLSLLPLVVLLLYGFADGRDDSFLDREKVLLEAIVLLVAISLDFLEGLGI